MYGNRKFVSYEISYETISNWNEGEIGGITGPNSTTSAGWLKQDKDMRRFGPREVAGLWELPFGFCKADVASP